MQQEGYFTELVELQNYTYLASSPPAVHHLFYHFSVLFDVLFLDHVCPTACSRPGANR
jgi:hypothetical protein